MFTLSPTPSNIVGARRRPFVITVAIAAAAIAVAAALPYGAFAEVTGLPAHPLIVHALVILLPLSALGIAVLVWFTPGFVRAQYAIVGAFTALTILGIAGRSSGDSLTAAVGLPEVHAQWGVQIPVVSGALLAAAVVHIVAIQLPRLRKILPITRGLVVLGAIATIVATVVVGHSGAEATWADRYAASKEAIEPVVPVISMAEVSQNASADSCWTVVDETVYDLTAFIARHPAGAEDILGMCGTDATDSFRETHSGQSEPEAWLERFAVGRLSP